MSNTAIKIECPLCQRKFTVTKAANHRKNHHPEITSADFVKKIRAAKSRGDLNYRTYKLQEAEESLLRSATDVLRDGKKITKSIRSVVSAGAFGIGKKR